MTPAEIKLKRTESILKELIPEALSELSDERMHLLDVIDVRCSKGRSDAKVYLDPHDYDDEEKRILLKAVAKARPIIEEHCIRDQGWFRAPKLSFVFDERLKESQRIEDLFAQIAKRKKVDEDA